MGRLSKNQVSAVVIMTVRLAASSCLSLRMSRTGGGRNLYDVSQIKWGIGQRLSLTCDNPTTNIEWTADLWMESKSAKLVLAAVVDAFEVS
jgi:hypothetical protein